VKSLATDAPEGLVCYSTSCDILWRRLTFWHRMSQFTPTHTSEFLAAQNMTDFVPLMSRAGSKKTRFEDCLFLPRDATLAPYMLSLHVHLSVRLSQADIVSKRLIRKYGYLQKLVYFPNTGLKISPRQVDHVVNKIRRRRHRRSSLLTTPIRQSTSRSCLLYKSIICNPLTHVLRLVADLLYNFCLQCFDAVGWAAGRASGL